MRNIMTSSEYMQMKENITLKIKENNVGANEAAVIVEKNLPKAEDYQSKLAKLIPAEVIGVYIFTNGILPASTGVDKYLILRWVIFGVLFVINPFYLRYVTAVTNKKQIVITTIGFAVWAFSLGGSFMVIGSDADFSRLVGSIILALYTLVVPMFITESPAQTPD